METVVIPCLRRVGNTKKFRVIQLDIVDKVTFGRAVNDVDVCLVSNMISRKHATLTKSADNRWQIQDHGSLNGVYVNDARLVANSPCVLSDKDVVRLGVPPTEGKDAEFVWQYCQAAKVCRNANKYKTGNSDLTPGHHSQETQRTLEGASQEFNATDNKRLRSLSNEFEPKPGPSRMSPSGKPPVKRVRQRASPVVSPGDAVLRKMEEAEKQAEKMRAEHEVRMAEMAERLRQGEEKQKMQEEEMKKKEEEMKELLANQKKEMEEQFAARQQELQNQYQQDLQQLKEDLSSKDPSPDPNEYKVHEKINYAACKSLEPRDSVASEQPSSAWEANAVSLRRTTRRSYSINGNSRLTRQSMTMAESLKTAEVKVERDSKTPTEERCMAELFTPFRRSCTPGNELATPVKTCSTPVMNLSQEVKDSKIGLTPVKRNSTPSKSKQPIVSHIKDGTSSPNKENSRKGSKVIHVSRNHSILEFVTRTPRSGQESKDRLTSSFESTPVKALPAKTDNHVALPKTASAVIAPSTSKSSESNDMANDDEVIIIKYKPSPLKRSNLVSELTINQDEVTRDEDNEVISDCIPIPQRAVKETDVPMNTKMEATTNNTNSNESELIARTDVSSLPCEMDVDVEPGDSLDTDGISAINGKTRGLKRKLDSASVYNAMKKIKLEVRQQGRFHHQIPSCPFSGKFESETNARLPLGTVMTSLIEAPIEENKVALGVDQLLLILSTKRYPSVSVLRTLLIKGFLNAQCTNDADKVYACLHQILLLHPPINPVLQQMYLDALQLQEGRESSDGKPWDILVNSLSMVFGSEDMVPDVYSNIRLFEFIVAVLRRDFQHAFASSSNNQLCQTLISQLVWPAGQVGIFNTRCQQILRQLAGVLQMNEDDFQPQWKVTKTELVGLILSIVTMIGEICYVAEKTERPCLLEETPQQAVTLAKELAFRLKDVNSNVMLETALSSIHSPWLVVSVTDTLLGNFDNTLVKPEEELSSVLTLQKIVSQYMFMLPTEVSSINSSPHSSPMYSPQRETPVNKKSRKGETPLHRACIRNEVSKVRELLATPGIEVNIQDNCGWTALHEAANHGHVHCVNELLNYKPSNTTIISHFKKVEQGGVNLLAAAEDGTTPLHDAVQWNHVEVALLLLEKGGDKLLKAKMTNGAVPEDLAYSLEMKDALNSFKIRMDRVVKTGKKRTKLHFFTESQEQDDCDINSSQLSSDSLITEPDPGPSDEMYKDIIDSCFSEENCLRLLLLVQRICLAYMNFYKLTLLALTLKDCDSHENEVQVQPLESVIPVRQSVCNEEATTENALYYSNQENSQNTHVNRLLEDLKVCQRMKYHLQDFKSHLLKISGRSNLDFCKGQLIALDLIFKV